MENITVVSTIFLANLSIVSILLLNEKSNCCFNNCLALEFRQSFHSFNPSFKWKI